MRYAMTKIWLGATLAVALSVRGAAAEAPVAVLNAMQLPIEDLDLGLDAPAPAVEAPVVEAPAVEAPAVEAPAAPALDVDALLGAPPAAEAPVAELPPAAEAPAAPALDVDALLGAPPAAEAPAAPAPDVDALLGAPPAAEAPVAELPPAAEAPVAEEAPVLAEEAPAGIEAPAVVEAPAPDPVSIIVSEMEALERVRREAQDRHGLNSLRQAQNAMQVGNFERAIREFQEALEFIGDRPGNAIPRREASDGLTEGYYRQALLLRTRGSLEEAHKAAVLARRQGHPKGEELVLQIDFEIKHPPVPPPPRVEKRWDEPTFRDNQEVIRGRMSRAREFYATGEYDKCREQLELIMRDNPFNTEAIAMLQRLGNRRYDVADAEFEATRREMIREVKSIWTPRNYAMALADIGVVGPLAPAVADVPPSVAVAIQEKMQRIILPEVNFREANLTDVIAFLSDASREYDDPNIPPERRGINFSLQLGRRVDPAVPAPGVPVDPFAPVADRAAVVGVDTPISFQARYVPLIDVLNVIMAYADLRYLIRGNIVQIVPRDAPIGELVHRMYNVLPIISERLVSFREERAGAGAVGDPFAMAAAEITATTDWKAYFGEFGVEWPDGSTIQHMPAIGKLVVKNTVENLAVLETVLAVINVTPKQIEIEARFVEVMQSDLESMGFEWVLDDDWELLEHQQDAGLPLEARRRLVVQEGSISAGFGFLNRRGVPGDAATTFPDDILTISSVLTNPELSMVLHMLSQRENTDLLSAPKVVTRNGSEATIKVVTEYIYPTEFTVEQPDITFAGGGAAGAGGVFVQPVVEPGGFETREVGVILQVVPEVTPDGRMINLTLAPQVVSEPTWRDYGPVYPDGTVLPMEQPFFPVRSIATSIQIYNGATVVMGGMITEVRAAREDKVPFLGDLPLLGRLFRYQYESSEKRNLLIFVTARLVDPAGRVVRDRPDLLPMAAEVAP